MVDAVPPLLGKIHDGLRPADMLLIGIDETKPDERIRELYNDSTGLHAARAKNTLNYVNATLGAQFNPGHYDYDVALVPPFQTTQPYLLARTAQLVSSKKMNVTLSINPGECIALPACRQFEKGAILPLAKAAGFDLLAQWENSEFGYTDALFQRR